MVQLSFSRGDFVALGYMLMLAGKGIITVAIRVVIMHLCSYVGNVFMYNQIFTISIL